MCPKFDQKLSKITSNIFLCVHTGLTKLFRFNVRTYLLLRIHDFD